MTLNEWLSQTSTSTRALASEIGVSQAAVSRWSAGRRIPRPQQMADIAMATNGAVTPADFYTAQVSK